VVRAEIRQPRVADPVAGDPERLALDRLVVFAELDRHAERRRRSFSAR